MGLLKLSRKVIKKEPELVEKTMEWLVKDCHARIKDVTTTNDSLLGYQSFLVEGEGIPKGTEFFDIKLQRNMQGSFNIEIVTPFKEKNKLN